PSNLEEQGPPAAWQSPSHFRITCSSAIECSTTTCATASPETAASAGCRGSVLRPASTAPARSAGKATRIRRWTCASAPAPSAASPPATAWSTRETTRKSALTVDGTEEKGHYWDLPPR